MLKLAIDLIKINDAQNHLKKSVSYSAMLIKLIPSTLKIALSKIQEGSTQYETDRKIKSFELLN